jgi:hypothetical protein
MHSGNGQGFRYFTRYFWVVIGEPDNVSDGGHDLTSMFAALDGACDDEYQCIEIPTQYGKEHCFTNSTPNTYKSREVTLSYKVPKKLRALFQSREVDSQEIKTHLVCVAYNPSVSEATLSFDQMLQINFTIEDNAVSLLRM